MSKRSLVIFLGFLHFSCARQPVAQSPVMECLAQFPQPAAWPDTLHTFLADSSTSRPLAESLLQAVLDSAQFASLHYDTGEARFWAVAQYPFADGYRAAIVQTEEHWFGQQNLLIMDPRQENCLAVVQLAHFYGGDGGQTATESWLMHSPDQLRLFVKTAEHSMVPSGALDDAPQEYLRETGQLFQWRTNQFRLLPNPDSLHYLKRFVMHRTW